MRREFLRSIDSALLAVLCITLIPEFAHPKGGRLSSGNTTGPIGNIHSLGEIAINGRPFRGENMVWNGDLLETPESGAAILMLNSIGEVRLDRNTSIRVAAARAYDQRYTLIAALTRGAMEVKLCAGASTRLEALGAVVTANTGSSFRLRLSEGGPLVDSVLGTVAIESQIKPKLTTSFQSAFPPEAQVTPGHFRLNKTKTNKVRLRLITFKSPFTKPRLVYASAGRPFYEPNQTQVPAANRKIRFALLGRAIGSFDQEVKTTDQDGIVEVEFTALTGGTATITATVDDIDPGLETADKPGWTCTMVVEAPMPAWKKVLIGSSIVAAPIIWRWVDHTPKPLHKEDPPVVNPPR